MYKVGDSLYCKKDYSYRMNFSEIFFNKGKYYKIVEVNLHFIRMKKHNWGFKLENLQCIK